MICCVVSLLPHLSHRMPASGRVVAARRSPTRQRAAMSVPTDLDSVRIQTSMLPDSVMQLDIELSASATQKSFDAAAAEAEEPGDDSVVRSALAALLSESVPAALQAQQSALQLIGQAALVDEPAALVERFKPGSALRLTMTADAWPSVSGLQRDDYMELPLQLPLPTANMSSKVDEAFLELRRRYPSPTGELLPLGDELANLVHEGLPMEELDALVRDRVRRESALANSKQTFAIVERALLEAVPVAIPKSLLVERARLQYQTLLQRAAEEAGTKGGEVDREEIRQMASWEAFERYLEQETQGLRHTLALSFAIQAVVDEEQLQIDPQAMEDNLGMYALEQFRKTAVKPDTDDPVFRERFQAEYVRETVLRFLLDNAKVEWTDDSVS